MSHAKITRLRITALLSALALLLACVSCGEQAVLALSKST